MLQFFFTENCARYAGKLLAPAEDFDASLIPPPPPKKNRVVCAAIKSQPNLKLTKRKKKVTKHQTFKSIEKKNRVGPVDNRTSTY